VPSNHLVIELNHKIVQDRNIKKANSDY
jgi:hypothetical protein